MEIGRKSAKRALLFSAPIPGMLASDSVSQKFRRDTVRLPSAPSGTQIAAFRRHTNRSVKLPSLRHFQDQVLTIDREKREKKKGLCFAGFVFLTFRVRSHPGKPNQRKVSS